MGLPSGCAAEPVWGGWLKDSPCLLSTGGDRAPHLPNPLVSEVSSEELMGLGAGVSEEGGVLGGRG